MKPLLLIVDDENDARMALKRTLKEDFEILEASSAEEALKKIAERPEVAIVLSDERLPGETGTELLGKIKALYPKTIRALISGQIDLDRMMVAVNNAEI